MMSRNLLGATSELSLAGPDVLDASARAQYYPSFRDGEQSRLLDHWRVVIKHKWIVVISLVLILIGSAIVSLRTIPLYRAEGQIMISRENPNPLGFKDSSTNDEDSSVDVELLTQVTILKSPALALEAMRQLQSGGELKAPTSNPDADTRIPLTGSAQLTEREKAQLASTFQQGLAVGVIPGTRVIQITYTSPKPDVAAAAVNALINAYITQNLRSRFEETNQAADWLAKQLSDLQLKVEISEEKLVRYQKEHGIVGTDDKQNIITAKLQDLNKQLTDAEADRIQKQAIYQLTLSGDPESVSTVSQDTFLQALRSQQADLKNQLAQDSVQLGSAYPKVVELRNRMQQVNETIDAEVKKTTSRIHNDYVGAIGREKMLRQAFEQQKEEASELNQNAIEYTLLKRDADSNRELYDSLTQKLKEASLSAGLSSTNVHIVDPARPPLKPFVPDILRNVEVGLLLGLTCGIALAFVFEGLDTTVRNPDQVEAIADSPALANIPLMKMISAGNKNKAMMTSGAQRTGEIAVLTYSRPKSEIAEAYRALRTSILLSMPDTPPQLILVTSPLPEDGKTTTSINCAIVMAQEGRRVLLVDADLRCPSISKTLGINARAGLSTILAGDAPPESLICPSPQLPNLFVLPSGPVPPRPSELINSTRMKALLAQWRTMFDHVIIDTAPILAVSEVTRLSVETDAVILVIRSGRTGKAALRRSVELLARVKAKLLGVVFNGFDSTSMDHYHYSYYGSKYTQAYYDGEETQTKSA